VHPKLWNDRATLTSIPKQRIVSQNDASFNDASRRRAKWRDGVMGGEDVPGGRTRDPGELLPLTPVALNVLLALVGGERHGYGIMLEVKERTGGRVRLGPGTLYGAIKRLKEGGLIEESGERPGGAGRAPDDERRRYYRLTGFGAEVLAAEVERLDGLVRAARRKGVLPAPKPGPERA
jgi:DNA-binding PadR family transcriptional regulator